MFALLFGAISLLYATIGQAGGTAFLALMALASFPSNEIRPTALLLNIVAAAYSAWLFNRASLVDWIKLAALAGAVIGTIVGLRWLSQTTTRFMLAAILEAAGIQLLFF
jgi:uncharacterized membrane protein YfcA